MTETCVLCGQPITDGETVIHNHSWWYHWECWRKKRPVHPPTAPFTYQAGPSMQAAYEGWLEQHKGKPMDDCPVCRNGFNNAITADERKGRFKCSTCGFDSWCGTPSPDSMPGTPLDPPDVNVGVNPAPLEGPIRAMCQKMADFLVEKNRAYGNSVGDPCGVFARRADPLLQMDVRIDDKINRLRKGSEFPGDDTVWDLAGYLILRQIVAEQQKQDGAK